MYFDLNYIHSTKLYECNKHIIMLQTLQYMYRFLESHWFIWCTQFNHLGMEMDVDDLKDWPARQVRIQYNLNNIIGI